MEFKYEIGGKRYAQKPLVLGQYRQLIKLLENVTIPADVTPMGFIFAIGDSLPKALATVLIEDGTSLKDKDIEALAEELELNMDSDLVMTVAADFFDCNQISSLLGKLGQTVEKITEKMKQTP